MPKKDTELVWSDKDTKVDRVKLPFQTVETLTEMRKLKQNRIHQFTGDDSQWPENYPKDWKNKLIWGDNKYIMSSLLKDDFKGEIDLIYIDPPFATGADFSMEIEVGGEDFVKEPSVIEENAYRDTWGEGMSSYLQMLYDRFVLMRDLLSEKGTVYVHLDWHVGHYVKVILDEVFGKDNFLNDIIWNYDAGAVGKKTFGRKHDIILRYSKGDNPKFNPDPVRIPYADSTLERLEHDGAREDNVEKVKNRGGKVPTDVWDMSIVQGNARENVNYPTQKPEELLERIIKASTDEGDLVADFFCGSGTTAATAEKLGRRWICTDLSKYSVQTTRKRLLDLQNYSKEYDKPCRPFEVQNLGSYQKHKFLDNGHPPVEDYREFILDLYDAQSMEGYSFIHGKKGEKLVHIAGVDSVVTQEEVKDSANECANAAGGKELDVLGWDYELGLDQAVEDIEEQYGIKINLKRIPKEAAELKDASKAGDEVKFFDLGYLEVDVSTDGKEVEVELEHFVLPNPEYIPDDVEEEIDSFKDFIDYWSVDFNYQDDTFHNMWQSFRSPNDSQLKTRCSHKYDSEGKREIFIKVIDIFGNDTNKVVEVDIDE